MRLKKLTISGFKSFADKVSIDFDSEIVGIVGPNGCGKSNIVDAFRWVMGEQSAKSLRGDKMHDVLFAGSDSRKPLNYAEVAITLTDIKDELPTPYEEITIARRLYRSGESEYYINKELARLKDVQSLFLGSGIGKNAFSIFEQGKLDQIIHLSPEGRRVIFDEAAGTSRFLLRKKETMRKLVVVSDNFARVHDVHAEIEKQTKQLKKQASHAKNFQENKSRLAELEREILLFRWKRISEKNAALEGELERLKFSFQEGLSLLSSQEELLNKHKERVLEEEISAQEQQKEFHLCETKFRVHEAESAQQKHRLLEMKKREEDVKGELQALSKEQTNSSKDLTSKEENRDLCAKRKEDLHKELTLKKEVHHAIEKELQLRRESVKKIQTEHLQQVQEVSKLSAALQERTFRHESKCARLQTLIDLEQKGMNSCSALEGNILSQRQKVETLSAQIDASKKDLNQEEQELLAVRKQIAEAQKEEHQLLRHMTEAEGHKKALNRLKEEMEGFSEGAKMLLKEAKDPKSPLYQKITPLFEYLSPKKGYENLLASALRPYAETLIVDSEEDFKELIVFVKKKKIGDFSLLVKNRIQAKKEVSESSLARYLDKNPIAYHFSNGIEVGESGNYLDALGVFFNLGSGRNHANVFLRQSELKSLEQTLLELQAKADEHRAFSLNLAEKLKLTEKRRNEIIEARRKKEMDLIQENFQLLQVLKDQEKAKKELESLKKEKEGLALLENEGFAIEESQKKLSLQKMEVARLFMAVGKQERTLETLQENFSQSALQMQEADAVFQEAKELWQRSNQEIEILKARQQQRELHEKKLEKEAFELRQRVESTLNAIGKKEAECDEQQYALKSLEKALREQEKRLFEAKKECERLDKELSQKRKALTPLEKERHSLEILHAKEFSEKESLENELQERHALKKEDLASQAAISPLEIPIDEAVKEMHRLRSAVDEAGAVNMTAIEEFQEAQDRFDFLNQQLKDLEESKKDLEEIIAKLDQESRKIFKKTFLQIRENFQKNFAILFKGGSADLTFTESSDILEAGIEIVAKPPGKQMRSISLLSGGEKCLTALALLFSIFEVRPAPFCILDEVDAPLDDTNIDRFTHVLKQFTDKTQFIIVTHNKKTMAIADLLIGVSMEEKGVSKLISLVFESVFTKSASTVF